MKIKTISDLHLEFGNTYMIPDFVDGDYDVLVIAGDLSDSRWCIKCLKEIDDIVDKPVIFVPGNHEYYHSSKYDVDKELKQTKFKHIKVLNNKVYKIDDVVFIGSTSWWYQGIKMNHIRSMNDFILINDIAANNSGMIWGQESKEFFTDALKHNQNEKVVCVSHNMPSMECISDEYKHSDINNCFATSYDHLIEEYQPEYWICGHTHDSIDMKLFNTQIICNPFGYYKHSMNQDFDINKTIEI